MKVTYKNQTRYKCDYCRKMIPKHKPVKVYVHQHDQTTRHFCGDAHRQVYIRTKLNLRFQFAEDK